MSGLNKPTIEGLIEKLLSDNHIKSDEVESVQNMLQAATSGMSPEEISTLIGTLNDRIDAPSSELLTSEGLNLNGFESAINETTKVIIREKVIREQEQSIREHAQTKVEDPLEKNLQEENNIVMSFDECMNFLENLPQKIPGLNLMPTTKEQNKKTAEIVSDPRFRPLLESVAEAQKNGNDQREAFKNAAAKLGVDWTFDEVKLASIDSIFYSVSEQMTQGKSDIEIDDTLVKNNIDMIKFVFESEENFRKQGGWRTLERIRNNIVQRTREKSINHKTENLKDAVLGEKTLTYDEVKSKIMHLEKLKIDYYRDIKKTLKKNNDQELTDEDSQKRDELFHEIANEYLATAKNFSNLYKYTQDNPLIQDMSFEEFFDRIIMDLKKNSDGSKDEKDFINTIILAERENRVMYLLAEQLSLARGNLQAETDDMSQRIEEYDINFERDSKRFREEYRDIRNDRKAFLCKKRGLDPKNYESKFEPQKKSAEECEKSINETNAIIRDRQEILKLAKESNISKEEAAKKYFAENEDARKHYTKKEQKFLFDDKNKVIRNKIIARLRTVLINRNERDIEKTKLALEEVREKVELESEELYNPEKLAKALKEERDLKEKLKKFEKRKKRNTRLRNGKNAFDIVDDKNRKNVQKDIMEMFANGKSAAEILKTLEENGNEHDFSFNEVLDTIISGNKRFLTVTELKQLRENEQKIYDISIQKYASEIKLKNVTETLEDIGKFKRQGIVLIDSTLEDWKYKYSHDVDNFNGEIEAEKPKSDKLRQKAEKRKKLVYRITTTEKKYDKKTSNSNESKENPVQEQQPEKSDSHDIVEEPTEQPIEVEEMAAPPKMSYDLTAVVRENKVTHSSMKESAEEIVDLKNKSDRQQDSTRQQDTQQVVDEDARQ